MIPGTLQSMAAPSKVISVKDYGAIRDGVTDDRLNIQAVIDSLSAAGGGTLEVPAGTYLLNSYSHSLHPWFFYNLIAGSNIKVQGTAGAKFLQGPAGRAAQIPGATQVRNTVLVFGNQNYIVPEFQTLPLNGGFYSLQPTMANSLSVILSNPAQASSFQVGDYVSLYASTLGDVIPGETSQVTSVNANTGILGLNHPLARSFSGNPVIANVAALATVNTGIDSYLQSSQATLDETVEQSGMCFRSRPASKANPPRGKVIPNLPPFVQ